MKIVTWNINGIRATKVPLKTLLDSFDADVICLQETKVTRDQLDEPSAIVEGYNSYFSFSKVKSGYSGVATFVKDSATPIKAEEGLTGLLTTNPEHGIGCYGNQDQFSDEELHSLDNEGRGIITQHKVKSKEGREVLLSVINVYCPRADPEREDRKTYKYRFYDILQTRAEALLKEGSHVIVLGDVNTAHRPIDHCDAEDKDFAKHKGRQWLDRFLLDPQKPPESQPSPPPPPPPDLNTSSASLEDEAAAAGHKFVDMFRYYYPDVPRAYSCWCSMTGARATNYGTRIDYIFADVELARGGFADCVIRPDVQGSDHCPVKGSLHWEVMSSGKCPPLCTKFLPEFAGKQQKLSSFFAKATNVAKSQSDPGSLTSSQESNGEEKFQFKRSAPDLNRQTNKKLKKEPKKVAKQGSLLNFFNKPKPSQETKLNLDKKQETKSDIESDKNSINSNESTRETSQENSSQDSKSQAVRSSQSDTWKALLKGLPPAPLCKGHREACLLRTVKKDSLNKGRQFYVCNRAEGHKNNPEARCDHFEWVEKKKKK